MSKRTNLKTWLAATLFLLAMACTAFGGQIIYVDTDANGVNDGSSWTNAYKYLQAALADANSAGGPIQIFVAEGIYTPDSNSAYPNGTGDREATFQLINGIIIKGGYAGFCATDPNARDVEHYETILSGDLNGDDVQVAELEKLLLERTRADNSYHVVTGSGADVTAVLDGFTISGGSANGSYSDTTSDGGGIYNDNGSPTITDCTFFGNLARGGGGGMYNDSSSPTVTNCTFRRNSAGACGGICCVWSSNPTIVNCVVSENFAAGTAGGIGCYRDSNPIIANSTVSGNSAVSEGGGIHCIWGGALITNCTISENLSWSYGGGIFCEHTPPTIDDCLITGNWAYLGGGGIDCFVSSPLITNCTINNNTSIHYQGGGIYCNGGSPKVANCIITGNLAYVDGGGIHLRGGGTAMVTNCTISANSAGRGGGSVSCESRDGAIVRDCILWHNSASDGPEITLHSSSQLNISYSNVRSGRAQVHVYAGCVLMWGEGNIDVDPCFVQLSYWDLNGTPLDANDDFWVDGDYSLKSQAGRWEPNNQTWVQDDVTSPCIDAGDPNSPIGLEPFPNGGRINMGAYGGSDKASKSYFGEPICETIIAGDINGDCKVDFLDFSLMALHWLENNTPEPPPPPPSRPPRM